MLLIVFGHCDLCADTIDKLRIGLFDGKGADSEQGFVSKRKLNYNLNIVGNV